MSGPLRDAIAAELALLERVKSPPTAPFGYGYDLYCERDLREDMLEIDGNAQPQLFLALALVRRLDCPRGSMPDDPHYGMDLRAYLNRGSTTQEIRTLAGRIRGELEKDDRVQSVVVQVTPDSTGRTLAVAIKITAVDPSVGGFDLILAVTSADVLIAELRRAA